MDIKTNVQKLGRSMLVPVSAMPLAGILLRLSAEDLFDIPILSAAGNAVFTNLDILFAIGVVFGFAKAKDKGMAALTAVLAILTLQQGLEIIDPDIDMGIFGGIVSGSMASWTYNRFKEQRLPQALSFFAGERFPLMVVLLVQVLVAVLFGFIWPPIQSGLDIFAQTWVQMGALGVGLFMFLNRLLIPLGLHHVINSYIYFDLDEYTNEAGEVFQGEIPRFLNGDPTAGYFLAGFFVIMMFGVPGICLAIYRTAYKANKERVKGIMGGGAFTSFLTNITEPVEFTFMFTAPILYVIHSIFAGLAGMVTYTLGIRFGFSFGASLIDFTLGYNIAENGLLVIPVGIAFFFLYYFTFSFVIRKMQLKTLGREDEKTFTEERTEEEKELGLETNNYTFLAKKMLESLGGKGNIEDAYNCVTRLRVTVNEADKVDLERIRQTGVSGVVKVSDTHYQIVIGPEVTSVMGEFNKLLDDE
ncbi:PTS system N-acetylglucosamine-specific IIB component, Glc family /PTS system N-acetylglucosamine-specific IIC component, Glc family [Pelagirhabdus alkalitolerans]|uniref:PTS system N-acetylglucosamine-specific IIB component, Glc family /PTS system N-acetylglucosamine-specific IIC component, Glc family n=1 Tax=Pelagirhabdus alkalitolerans TaxID=1612202 RepID=A0A1G6GPM7_9BACI|nr:PTS transporter subunit EIIC [Pelagirhabdus alkalitolerans]SDB83715.1 PTS system N-acetylglucosamine-specific IIB component, Glc family /PTS system N-acetylglucosamine-specific IIC component, Glc family [Pelagirhabdus alkalitolerans]